MVALAIFIIGGLGVIEMLGLINNNATADRALTAARMLVNAKIAKAQTDTWTPSNSVVPMACKTPYTGPSGTNVPYEDLTDGFDASGVTAVAADNTATIVSPIVVNAPDASANPLITGTWTQTVTDFEVASQSKLITYTLTFTYRGKTYSVSQSTVRAPDQL